MRRLVQALSALAHNAYLAFPWTGMLYQGPLKALCGPYRMARFLPTGGITAANLTNYLALPQVVACGGSWMVAPDLLETAAWDQVTELTAAAVAVAAAARP